MVDVAPVSARKTLYGWWLEALGLPYAIMLPLAGVICFAVALLIVLRGKGPMAAAGLILVVHVPLLVGVFAFLQDIIGMSNSLDIYTPKPEELTWGFAMAAAAPMIGMVLMIPGYATAVIGAIVRSFAAEGGQR